MKILKLIIATIILFTAHSNSTAQTFEIDRTNMVCGGFEATLYAVDPSCTIVGTATITIPFGTSTIFYSTAALIALFPPLPPVWEVGAIDIYTPVACTPGPSTGSSCPDDIMTVGNSSCSYSTTGCMVSSPIPSCGTCVTGVLSQATFTSGTAASVALY